MKVDIFIPCYIDQACPETGFNMVKVLEKAGVKVSYNKHQTCCGRFSFDDGYWDHAKSIGEKFIKDFIDSEMIVSPSASCVTMVRKYYDELFYNSALHNEYRKLRKVIFEFSDFLVNKLNVKDVGATFNHNVFYCDSGAAHNEYGLKNEPLILLKHVRGLKLVESESKVFNCNFEGFAINRYEIIYKEMAAEIIQAAVDSSAEYIISTDANSLLFLQGCIKEKDIALKTAHLADVLASGYDG